MHKPFVHWAGGKTQLLGELQKRLPESFGTYYEPFAGGAALLLNTETPNGAVLSDTNRALMNAYSFVKREPELVLEYLEGMDHMLERGGDYYYDMRKLFNEMNLSGECSALFAAAFIFLNKHCFNGLYRVNRRGEFNVPWNGRSNPSAVRDELMRTSDRLQGVTISWCDFASKTIEPSEGDFVYFDSPYAPLDTNTFTQYTAGGFTEQDHLRLRDHANRLTSKGVKVMLSNHNTPFVQDLYEGWNIDVVNARRSINRDGSNRKGVEEVIVRNYE